MGGNNTDTATQTTGSTNPNITSALNSLLGTFNGVNAGGPTQTYAGPTTWQGWQSALNAANAPEFSSGLSTAYANNNALQQNGGLNAGQQSALGTTNQVGQGYGALGANGGLNATQWGNLGQLNGVASGYGGLTQNGGLNSTQQGALGSLGGLGGQYASLGQNGGLTGAQQQALGATGQAGQGFGALANSGMTPGMGANIDAVNRTANYFGALGNSYRQPGIMEQNLMGTAQGQFLNGANPYFEANLGKALDTAGAGVNASVGAGGRFGSGAHVNQLGSTLGNLSNSARGAQYEMERDRQLQALSGIGSERQQGIGNQLAAMGQQQAGYGQAFGMQNAGIGNQLAGLSGQLSAAGQQAGIGQQGVGNQFGALQGQQGLAGQQFGMGQEGTNNILAGLGGLGSTIGQQFGMSQTGTGNQFGALAGQGGQAAQAFGMGQTGIGNQMGAGNNLANLFGMGQLPSSVYGAVGQGQDANQQAASSAWMNHLAQLSQILGINNGTAGTTTTETTPATPLWQTLLGGTLGLGSLFA